AASLSLRRAGTLPSSDDLRLPFGALDCAALRRSVRENGCPRTQLLYCFVSPQIQWFCLTLLTDKDAP
ncbi:MAG TPA: hypothetical protein PKX07_09635, partial [Aggregatilineales bacterium]|nr:hypothetical protein [Aggregatilineales bacterium]